jgi:glutaryl-CoA dehydrogenase
VARDWYECALEYSNSREQFGKPSASFQLTQEKLVDMMLEINKDTMIAQHIGRLKDEGRVRPEHISFGKLNNIREAIEIAREARTILGGNGIMLEYPVIRHAKSPNSLESVRTYEGTDEVHTMIRGQALTIIPDYR